jgi:hypothetical protein
VALLQDFVDGNEGFECLDFVGKNRLARLGQWGLCRQAAGETVHFHALPKGGGAFVVPRVDNATANMFPYGRKRIALADV